MKTKHRVEQDTKLFDTLGDSTVIKTFLLIVFIVASGWCISAPLCVVVLGHPPFNCIQARLILSFSLSWLLSVLPTQGRLHPAGHRPAAGSQLSGVPAAGARHQGQGAAARPAHRRPQGRHQVCCPAAAERPQRRRPVQGEEERRGTWARWRGGGVKEEEYVSSTLHSTGSPRHAATCLLPAPFPLQI